MQKYAMLERICQLFLPRHGIGICTFTASKLIDTTCPYSHLIETVDLCTALDNPQSYQYFGAIDVNLEGLLR